MKPEHVTTQQMLLSTFLEESFDGLERLEAGLLQLDAGMSLELIDELFRVVHSMKGGAGVIGVVELGALVHAMESILDGLRRGQPPAADTAGLLLRGADAIRTSLHDRQIGRKAASDANAAITAELERHAARPPAVSAPARPVAVSRWVIEIAPHRELMTQGVDPSKLLRGLAALGAIQLVFQPGFSTTSQVSALSGCGVGMDVVRRHIKDLGGERGDVAPVHPDGRVGTARDRRGRRQLPGRQRGSALPRRRQLAVVQRPRPSPSAARSRASRSARPDRTHDVPGAA